MEPTFVTGTPDWPFCFRMQLDWSVCQVDHTVVSPYRYKPRVIRMCQDEKIYQWSSLSLGRRFATDTPRQCLLGDD
jgi:hypothetical protein